MNIQELHSNYLKNKDCSQTVLSCIEILQGSGKNSTINVINAQELSEKINEVNNNLQQGQIKGLEGVVVSLKDVLMMEGYPATGGSKFLEKYIAPYSATVIKRLENAGAIIISKDNCDMFGHGSTTSNTYFGTTLNAKNETFTPGGSSGGTAVTVAIGGAHIGIGSDTGGSIRQPAVYNGLVGFKPSYGAVSRFGLMAYASSLDTVGPITNNVEDAITAMNIIGGKDDNDYTSHDYGYLSIESAQNYSLKDKVFGIYDDFISYPGLNDEIKIHMNQIIDFLKEQGAKIIILPFFKPEVLVATYYIIAMAETASNLSRLTGVGYGSRLGSNTFEDIAMQSRAHGLSEETQKRIIIGNQILSSGDSGHYYKKAQQIRKEINKAFDNDFGKVNFILSPVTPHSAPLVKSGSYDKDVYLNDMYTVGFSLGKNPTIALPTTNFNGIQISGKYKDDHEVLKCAYAIQNLLPH